MRQHHFHVHGSSTASRLLLLPDLPADVWSAIHGMDGDAESIPRDQSGVAADSISLKSWRYGDMRIETNLLWEVWVQYFPAV